MNVECRWMFKRDHQNSYHVSCSSITYSSPPPARVLPCPHLREARWDNPAGKHEARSQYTLHPSKQEVPKGLAHQRQEAQSANQHPQPTPPIGKYTKNLNLARRPITDLQRKLLHIFYLLGVLGWFGLNLTALKMITYCMHSLIFYLCNDLLWIKWAF